MSERIVEGLRLLVKERESAMRSSVYGGEKSLKERDEWLEGDAMARSIERFAQRILAAVEEYRGAKQELADALAGESVSR